jgi:hypothetical protein
MCNQLRTTLTWLVTQNFQLSVFPYDITWHYISVGWHTILFISPFTFLCMSVCSMFCLIDLHEPVIVIVNYDGLEATLKNQLT